MIDCDIEDLIGGILLAIAGAKLLATDTLFGGVCVIAGIYLAATSVIYIPPAGV